MNSTKSLWFAVVVVAIIAIGGYFFPLVQNLLGASGTRFPNGLSADTTSPSVGQVRGTSFLATGSLKVSSTGTSVARLNGGLCYIAPGPATITASSTVNVDCQATASISTTATAALTGVTAGDFFSVTLSTSTAATGGSSQGGLVLVGASASTTAGYIHLKILNNTGATYTWPTSGIASGTASYIGGR